MITEDGRLDYAVDLPLRRGWRHRLRHVVNPVVGIVCGLALGAALFLIAVQGLFGVRPSLAAVVLAVVAVIGYAVEVWRARVAARTQQAYHVTLHQDGVTVDDALLPWARFVRWLEDEQDLVLTSGGVRGRMIVVLPKTDLPDDELDLLREVLHAHIDPEDEPLEDAFVEMDWDAEPVRRVAD